jgi:hypothetical protein
MTKSTDLKQVADALKTVSPWDTVLGALANRDITNTDYVWSVWHKGVHSERYCSAPHPRPLRRRAAASGV